MSQPTSREERSLTNLERTIIHRHFKGLSPRQVRLVDAVDFDARAREPELELNAALAREPRAAEAAIKHALLHYEFKDGGWLHWYGHGRWFQQRAEEVELSLDGLSARCVSVDDWLNNPHLRSGPDAVSPRGADLIFGLARVYGPALERMFLAGGRAGEDLPRWLLPWVDSYAGHLADLLSVKEESARIRGYGEERR